MKPKNITQLQKTNHKIFLAITGGGTDVIPNILKFGGSSKIFLGSFVPYANEALASYINRSPEKYCSRDVAKDMAMKAYHDARAYSHNSLWSMGVGVTASLMKAADEREGRLNTLYIAIQTKSRSASIELTLGCNAVGHPQKFNNRLKQEKAVANAILDFILYFDSNDRRDIDSFYDTWEHDNIIQESNMTFNEQINDVILGNKKQGALISKPKSNFIFPGSFNPIHETHLNMIHNIAIDYNTNVDVEISIENVDKAKITHEDLSSRISTILNFGKHINNIHITRLPRFIDKAAHFQNSTFILGTDTFERLVNIKYYHNLSDMISCLKTIVKEYNCNFIVFERLSKSYDTIDLSMIKDKAILNAITKYPQIVDTGISSTLIRNTAPQRLTRK